MLSYLTVEINQYLSGNINDLESNVAKVINQAKF